MDKDTITFIIVLFFLCLVGCSFVVLSSSHLIGPTYEKNVTVNYIRGGMYGLIIFDFNNTKYFLPVEDDSDARVAKLLEKNQDQELRVQIRTCYIQIWCTDRIIGLP